MNFTNFWIYGFCVVSLWSLFNPFIHIWLGDKYVFDKYIVFAILLNFYTAGMQNASTTFRDTTGLFKRGKYRPIIAAVINVVVSMLLVQKMGIAGVLLGTVISRFCTYFWYDPYVIFRFVFKRSVMNYFVRYMSFVSLVTISAILTDMLGSLIHTSLILNIVIRAVLCLIIPNFIFFMIFRRSEEFKYLWNIAHSITNKIPSRLLVKESP